MSSREDRVADGLDEPADPATDDDHAALLSELDSHDLGFVSEVADPEDRAVFDADPGDPDANRCSRG